MENNTSLSIRLKQFIDSQDISISKFSQQIGVSNSLLNKFIKNNSTLGSDKIENILRKFPNLNSEWLLTGNGEMVKNGNYKQENAATIISEPTTLTDNLVADYLINNWERMLQESQKFEMWYRYITMKATTDLTK